VVRPPDDLVVALRGGLLAAEGVGGELVDDRDPAPLLGGSLDAGVNLGVALDRSLEIQHQG
jgi:hypothetical protein